MDAEQNRLMGDEFEDMEEMRGALDELTATALVNFDIILIGRKHAVLVASSGW